MRHFRDFAPDAALPDYSGKQFDYPDDAFQVGIGKLVAEFEAVIVCHGESDGRWYAERVVLMDAYHNRQTFTRGGSSDVQWLRDAVFAAVEGNWPAIEAWLCEQAEDE